MPQAEVQSGATTSGEPHASRRSHWVNHLGRHAHGRPEGVAFRFRAATTTWRELHGRVERLVFLFFWLDLRHLWSCNCYLIGKLNERPL